MPPNSLEELLILSTCKLKRLLPKLFDEPKAARSCSNTNSLEKAVGELYFDK